MNLTESEIEQAQTYIAYVWAWKQTGKYHDIVAGMKKKIRVSNTSQPTIYNVCVNGKHGTLSMNSVEVRWKQEELGIKKTPG